MSNGAMLKKLLEAENASRGLILEAQETADKRIREELLSLQEDLRKTREERIREITAEEENFSRALSAAQIERLSVFEESLKSAKISYENAERELKKILLP